MMCVHGAHTARRCAVAFSAEQIRGWEGGMQRKVGRSRRVEVEGIVRGVGRRPMSVAPGRPSCTASQYSSIHFNVNTRMVVWVMIAV